MDWDPQQTNRLIHGSARPEPWFQCVPELVELPSALYISPRCKLTPSMFEGYLFPSSGSRKDSVARRDMNHDDWGQG
jgi:hypothetical protein